MHKRPGPREGEAQLSYGIIHSQLVGLPSTKHIGLPEQRRRASRRIASDRRTVMGRVLCMPVLSRPDCFALHGKGTGSGYKLKMALRAP